MNEFPALPEPGPSMLGERGLKGNRRRKANSGKLPGVLVVMCWH